jgi:ABC-type Fe3+/spermidine/putrescine transport system ATPase subunit
MQRRPQDLSPGEKQRVALARALASSPDLFLFDEPFAALDTQTRDQLREELRSFLRAVSIPAIFVTHDHNDAMILADRIVVLRDGAIIQSGPAKGVYARPANSFVARFVCVENILDARVAGAAGELATIVVGDRKLYASVPAHSAKVGDKVRLGIRAEEVILGPPESKKLPSPAVNRFNGRITSLRSQNPLVTVEIARGFLLQGYLLTPRVRAMNIEVGSQIAVEIAADAVHVMPN